jgi:hypothetical protein
MAESCKEQLDALEAELEEAAERSISASTGGQGVAASREAQAQEVEPQFEEPAVPYQKEHEEAAAIERAEDAGEGGEVFMQAKALLEEARAAAQEDDDAGCRVAHEAAAALLEEHRQKVE